jgi:hypothetical protein
MSNNVSLKKSQQNMSLIDWITQYDSLVVFGGFGLAIMGVILFTGIFQAGPVVRDNVLYNALGAMAMAIGFIYIIFKFMGNQVIILGKQVDIGMFVYVAIVLFVMFVLGN